MRRLLVVAVPLLGTATPFGAPTAVASSTTTVAGTAVLDTTRRCPDPPMGYEDFTDYPPIVMSGELQGCWYTHIDRAWDLGRPTGLHFEGGREVFVGDVKGKSGSFSTVFFELKWDPDVTTGTEVWGQCQHPIVRGSGRK